jgi:hypothetical protein
MKTYTFFVVSRQLTITVPADHSWDAKQIVMSQFAIKDSRLIVRIGINLPATDWQQTN